MAIEEDGTDKGKEDGAASVDSDRALLVEGRSTLVLVAATAVVASSVVADLTSTASASFVDAMVGIGCCLAEEDESVESTLLAVVVVASPFSASS